MITVFHPLPVSSDNSYNKYNFHPYNFLIIVRPLCNIRCPNSFDMPLRYYKLKTNTYYNPHPIDPRIHDPPHSYAYETILYMYLMSSLHTYSYMELAYCVESSLSSSTSRICIYCANSYMCVVVDRRLDVAPPTTTRQRRSIHSTEPARIPMILRRRSSV